MSAAGGRRRTIGSMLVELGRIEESDVERALEYQREHGGFMGEALVALQLVTHEEIGWALAGQFDLPFVRLRPGETDLETARLVDVEWARDRNAIPAVRAGSRLTVVLSDPTRGDAILDEVRERTGFDEVDLALAPAGEVSALIDAAFGVRSVAIGQWIEDVRRAGARRFGVSERGGRAVGWSEGTGASEAPLEAGWREALREILRPFPEPEAGEPVRWSAEVAGPAAPFAVDCTALRGPGTYDFAARLRDEPDGGAPVVDAGLVRRVRELREGGGAVVLGVPPGAEATTGDMVALLAAILGGTGRIFVLADRAVDVRGTPVVQWNDPDDAEPLEALADFLPAAVVVETEPGQEGVAARLPGVAPLSAVRSSGDDPGVDLELTLRAGPGGRSWHAGGADGTD